MQGLSPVLLPKDQQSSGGFSHDTEPFGKNRPGIIPNDSTAPGLTCSIFQRTTELMESSPITDCKQHTSTVMAGVYLNFDAG